MPRTSLPPESERAAVAAPGVAVVASPRPCPVCGQAMAGRRTSACSDKCRAAKSRRRRLQIPAEDFEAIRARLMTVLEALGKLSQPAPRRRWRP